MCLTIRCFQAVLHQPKAVRLSRFLRRERLDENAKHLKEQIGQVSQVHDSPFATGYVPGLGRSGFRGGAGFFSGLEMPMLISTNFSPLRNVSTKLILAKHPYFVCGFAVET
jgi:hypothetical protein